MARVRRTQVRRKNPQGSPSSTWGQNTFLRRLLVLCDDHYISSLHLQVLLSDQGFQDALRGGYACGYSARYCSQDIASVPPFAALLPLTFTLNHVKFVMGSVIAHGSIPFLSSQGIFHEI
jgi:hypothetical protein